MLGPDLVRLVQVKYTLCPIRAYTIGESVLPLAIHVLFLSAIKNPEIYPQHLSITTGDFEWLRQDEPASEWLNRSVHHCSEKGKKTEREKIGADEKRKTTRQLRPSQNAPNNTRTRIWRRCPAKKCPKLKNGPDQVRLCRNQTNHSFWRQAWISGPTFVPAGQSGGRQLNEARTTNCPTT